MLFGGTYYYPVFGVRVFHHLFTGAILAIWLVVRLLRRRGLPPTPLNPLLYLGVFIWFVSALLSLDPRMALENLWFPLTHLLIFFIMVDIIQRGRETLLTETILLVAALVVMLAGAQLVSWFFGLGFATPAVGWADVLAPDLPFPLAPPRLFVPLGVSTWLAAFTAPLVIFAGAWAWSARQRGARRALWVLAALLLAVTLLTSSRGGWISLGAGGGVFALLMLMQDRRLRSLTRRYAIPLAVVLVLAAAVVGLLLIRQSGNPNHAVGDILRFDLWRGALSITREHPLLGVGPGLFGKAYRLVRAPDFVDNRLGTAHNYYLNSLAETGIIGIAVAAALGVVLLRSWWKLWQSAETPARKTHLAGALAALVGFGAQSCFDTFTGTPLVLLAFALMAYCVTAPRSRIDPPLKGSLPAAFASLALVVLYTAGLLRSDQAQADFNASLNGNIERARAAAAADPALNLYSLQVAYLQADQLPPDADPAAAIAGYQHALTLEPSWDTGWINLAALYQRQGQIPQALDALQRAISIDHANGARLQWARLAEEHAAAPEAAIVQAYAQELGRLAPGDLPLAPFWAATELRRQALEDYLQQVSLEYRYRILAAHDPDRLAALVPAEPDTPAEWWVAGEYALTVAGDAPAADAAFSEAIRRHPNDNYLGDYYAARARARVSLDAEAAQRDLDIATLLGTLYESPNATRALLSDTPEQQARSLAAAVPPQILQQNFEGVLFAGRVAAFRLLPEMRPPGPGRSRMQPWYDLAALYDALGQPESAENVRRAIREREAE